MNLTQNPTNPFAIPPSSRDATVRLLIDQIVDCAIYLLTPLGEIATWNLGAQRIKGYKPEEIIGKHFRVFFTPEAQARRMPERELEVATAKGRSEGEGWRVRRDGSRFWASVILTAIRDSNGQLLGFGKVTRDLTERRRAEDQLRELSQTLLRLQDKERGKLGRELHDTVGQYLVVAKMSLDGLLAEQTFDEIDTRKGLSDAIVYIDRAIREVRTLSYLLYPPMLEEMGLASAMRWHLEGFSKRSGIATTCHITDTDRLPRDMELALFRVFQESLANVHRHSGSKTAEIRFLIEDGHAILEIKDHGKGMPPELVHLEKVAVGRAGVGIRGMYERVRQLNGAFSISCNGGGTTVKATVPLNSSSEEPTQAEF